MADDKDKDKDKFVVFPGGSTPDINAEAIRKMKANMAILAEYQSMTAQMHRNKYLALVKAGFSDKEALELCKVLP